MPGPAPGFGMAAEDDMLTTVLDRVYRRYTGEGSALALAAESTASSLTSLVVSVPETLEALVGQQNLAQQDIGAMWAIIGVQGLELRDMGNKATAALEAARLANGAAASGQALASVALGVGSSASNLANAAYGIGVSALGNAATAQQGANAAYGLGITGIANAATAQRTAGSAYSLGLTGIGNAAAAQGTANAAYGLGVTGIANAATAQQGANAAYSLGITGIANAATAQQGANAAYGLGVSALANAATAQSGANAAYGLGASALANAATAQRDASVALTAAAAAQRTADRALASGGAAGLSALEKRVDTISRRNVEQDRRMTGIVNANQAQGEAIGDVRSLARSASNKVDRLRDDAKGSAVIAFRWLDYILGATEAQEASRADYIPSGYAGGLARGGFAPPGWAGWVGEEGPELMRVGSRGATVTDARRSAAMAGQPTVVNVYLDSRAIGRAMTSGAGTTSSLKPV